MGRPPMGWAPAVFGRFLKPGGRGGRPKLELAFPTMPLVRENARSLIHAIIEIPDGDEENGVNNFTKVEKGLSRELVQVYLSKALVSS